jgi:choline dehydrogenase
MDEADVIIVGAGSAGCALADRLSADGRRQVLLLEAGGSDRRFWIKAPIGYGKTFFDAAVNWKFATEPDPGLGGRASYWPRGKVLGGSSSINAMVYCRGLPSDYDDWREAGNPGWGWTDVEPSFRAIERRVPPDGAAGSGALWVSNREADYHPIKRHFYAAARKLGLPIAADFNGSDPEGVGAYSITTRAGLRCSSADAFLRPAMGRRNLDVRTHVFVERVLFERRRAVGVECRLGDARVAFKARAGVILAAGAVNSPLLLQLSGIGPPDLLGRLGIDVVHANGAVGGALQDHLGINYFYRAQEPTLNAALGTWRGRFAAGLKFLLARAGPLSLSVNQMGGMVRSSPSKPRPNVQIYFSPLSYSTEIAGERRLLRPDRFAGFIIGFNACRPTSSGRIEAASGNPADPPRIMPNYLFTDTDIAEAIQGARLIGRLQDTRAMRRLIAGEPLLDIARSSDGDILADFRARSGTVYHPCGTCRMAPEARGGVVDAELRVHGVERLRVVDASVFPNITSANINAAVIMLAYKAGGIIKF